MRYILRLIALSIIGMLICIAGTIYCLFKPANPKNAVKVVRYFTKMCPLIGLKVIGRHYSGYKRIEKCIYIANHQSNFDVMLVGAIAETGTVAVGKKSLFWIPFFGLLFWLTGNILIDRNNKNKARESINQVIAKIKDKNLSIWMFPEGTRNHSKGLLPFKMGAFHAAISAKIPIVPICISDTLIDLNRRNNGHVILEMLPPIDTSHYNRENIRELAQYCHDLMEHKINILNEEVAQLKAN